MCIKKKMHMKKIAIICVVCILTIIAVSACSQSTCPAYSSVDMEQTEAIA